MGRRMKRCGEEDVEEWGGGCRGVGRMCVWGGRKM